jgi:hypothetical protein
MIVVYDFVSKTIARALAGKMIKYNIPDYHEVEVWCAFDRILIV